MVNTFIYAGTYAQGGALLDQSRLDPSKVYLFTTQGTEKLRGHEGFVLLVCGTAYAHPDYSEVLAYARSRGALIAHVRED